MRTLAALLLFAMISTAVAVQPAEQLADPALEGRAREISAGLRCLVCQNQSIDDSDAPLARDLRLLVRERLSSGDSDTEIRDYLVARYGGFILLRPQLRVETLLLWLTPLIVLAAGAAVLFVHLRRKPENPSEPLSADEEEQLARLIQAQD